MVRQLAKTFHLDIAETRVFPLVNSVFDVAFNHRGAVKEFEVELIVYPGCGCLRGANTKQQ